MIEELRNQRGTAEANQRTRMTFHVIGPKKEVAVSRLKKLGLSILAIAKEGMQSLLETSQEAQEKEKKSTACLPLPLYSFSMGPGCQNY